MKKEKKAQTSIEAWNKQSQESADTECNHDCRVACKMLTEVMRKEAEMIDFYEKLMKECDYPDVHTFIRELLEEKSSMVLNINQKLNEIRARGQVSNGIISSFDPDASLF